MHLLAMMWLRKRYPSLKRLCDLVIGQTPIEDKGQMYCSMLVAATLRDAGALSMAGRHDLGDFDPGDFARDVDHEATQAMDTADPPRPLFAEEEVEIELV
jgi:hypothetical protein